MECFNNEDNCKGGSSNFTCIEGHIGPLCETCDLYGEKWGEAYAHSDEYDCAPCSLVSSNLVKIILISLF